MVRKIKNKKNGEIKTNFPLNKVEEEKIMQNLKLALYKKYDIKKYSDPAELQELLKFLYDYRFETFSSLIKSNSNYKFLKKLIQEYENSNIIIHSRDDDLINKFFNRNLNGTKYRIQFYKRGLKYLIEQVAYNIEKNGETKTKINYTELFVYLEELFQISGTRYSVNVFNDFSFEINPDTYTDFYTFKMDNSFLVDFPDEKFKLDKNYFDEENAIIFKDSKVIKAIEKFCIEEFDINYEGFIKVFDLLLKISNERKLKPIFKRKSLINEIKEKSPLSFEVIDKIINDFTINSQEINDQLYNPKRPNRIYKKIFLKIEENLIVSEHFILEGKYAFLNSVYFNKFPSLIEKGKYVSLVSNAVGTSFENFVEDKFMKNNYTTFKTLKKYINSKEETVDLTKNGGEVDLIAFNNDLNKCYLIECKMLDATTEPRYYLDDKNKFFGGKTNYIEKFQDKINYFKNNKFEVLESLAKKKEIKLDIDKLEIENKLLIFYPSPLEGIIDKETYDFDIENTYLFFENSIKK